MLLQPCVPSTNCKPFVLFLLSACFGIIFVIYDRMLFPNSVVHRYIARKRSTSDNSPRWTHERLKHQNRCHHNLTAAVMDFRHQISDDVHHITTPNSHNRRSSQNLTHTSSQNLLNADSFHYLILEDGICTGDSVFLLVYVATAPRHFEHRMHIRETWATPEILKQLRVRVIFLLGTANDHALEANIKSESNKYHDIIQEDYVDSYRNLTYKSLSGAKWIVNYCMNARFVMKLDDDVFVNIWALTKKIDSMSSTHDHMRMYFMCRLMYYSKPEKNKNSKWFVRPQEFKPEFYPPYCHGFVYIYTPFAAEELYKSSFEVPFFWIEDVYFTGLLAKKIGMHFENFGHLIHMVSWQQFDEASVLTSHSQSIHRRNKMWKSLIKTRLENQKRKAENSTKFV